MVLPLSSSPLEAGALSRETQAVVQFSAGEATLGLRFSVLLGKGSALLVRVATGELIHCSSSGQDLMF